MSKNSGGPAFPEVTIQSGDNYNAPKKIYWKGMTLRDYFAASALQGILSCQSEEAGFYQANNAAKEAYELADAMLEARKESAT